MNAKVRRHPDRFDLDRIMDASYEPQGEIRSVGFASPRDGFIIQCEVTHPPSQKGKKIALYLTEKDRDDLMRVLKQEAIRARRS